MALPCLLLLEKNVVCGVFRYNISAESLAKSTLSQGHGLSMGGVSIYIYVCMYVCMYICMYASMHGRMYVCMYVCIYANHPPLKKYREVPRYRHQTTFRLLVYPGFPFSFEVARREHMHIGSRLHFRDPSFRYSERRCLQP